MVRRTYKESLEAMEAYKDAQHYKEHPAHAFALLRQISALTLSVVNKADNDPMLFAYQLRDMHQITRPLMAEVMRWADDVITSDTAIAVHTGVKSCLIET